MLALVVHDALLQQQLPEPPYVAKVDAKEAEESKDVGGAVAKFVGAAIGCLAKAATGGTGWNAMLNLN